MGLISVLSVRNARTYWACLFLTLSACGGHLDRDADRLRDAGPTSPGPDAPQAPADADSAASSDATATSDARGTVDAADVVDALAWPLDAPNSSACARGPTVLHIDARAGDGGSPPVDLTDNDATWSGRVLSGVYMQLNVQPIAVQQGPSVLGLNGVPSTAIAPGHYNVPSTFQFTVQAAGVPCQSPTGTVDIFAYGDTGGDEASLALLQASFQVQCVDSAPLSGCINYSATPAVPPPDPSSSPGDPLAGCGGSARDVVRAGDLVATNLDAVVSADEPFPNDLRVDAGRLSLEFVAPAGFALDTATYGPGAPAVALPNITLTISGDVACDATSSSFTLFGWSPPTDAGQGASLILAFDCRGASDYRGCVRFGP